MADLNEHTKAELVEMGKELGLELNERSNKDVLVESITSALLEKNDQPVEMSQPATKNEINKHPKFHKFKGEK